MCLDYLSGNPETSSNKNMAGNRAISENLWLCGFNEYSSLISLLHTTDEYILPETLSDYVNVPQFSNCQLHHHALALVSTPPWPPA